METPLQPLDQDACYRAALTRDARFDGRFFGGVTSTGIYCRPVCPARTPKRENMIFYPSAAAAEAAGFRACLRCRPETAPDLASWRAVEGGTASVGGAWRGTWNTVSRALALIEGGALDGGDVEALADRLGIGERQLRRLFRQHLGAAPVSVAQTRRVLLAKQLIHETGLSMAEVAMASGFGSVRRFNETFQRLYDRPPSALRRRKAVTTSGEARGIRMSLSYREPYDWDAMFETLEARGDRVERQRWMRDLSLIADGATGQVILTPSAPGKVALDVEISDLTALPGVLSRVRRVFDLSADPTAIARDLSRDPLLRPLVEARPGLRLPGNWIEDRDDAPSDRIDGFRPDARRVALIETGRAEAWRPWRAYAALHLTAAGPMLNEMERPDDQAAA